MTLTGRELDLTRLTSRYIRKMRTLEVTSMALTGRELDLTHLPSQYIRKMRTLEVTSMTSTERELNLTRLTSRYNFLSKITRSDKPKTLIQTLCFSDFDGGIHQIPHGAKHKTKQQTRNYKIMIDFVFLGLV